jgi:PAS domain S-box-containing protein
MTAYPIADRDHPLFRALVDNYQGIIALLDKDLHILFRSASGEKLTGWSNEELTQLPKDYIDPELLPEVMAVYSEALANPGRPITMKTRLKHKNGRYVWLEGTVTNQLGDPAIGGIIVNLQDVTQRKEAEDKLLRLNRLYLFISEMNKAIAKADDENALFREACRIAVNVGRFPMAWVGVPDPETGELKPVAHAGEEQSYPSSIGLPIKQAGKVVCLFSLYADKKNFFDAEEIGLLEGIAVDISFAMELFEQEYRRRQAEEQLVKSKLSYQTLAESSPVGIFHTDATGYTTYVNPRWSEISGMPAEKAIGNGWLEGVHPGDREALARAWQDATASLQTSVYEYRFVRPDGSIAWVLGQAVPERSTNNEILGYVGTATDITALKMAEQVIANERNLSDSIINSLPGIFYLITREGQNLRWNANFEKVSGYSGEEIGRMHPMDFFEPDQGKVIAEKIEEVFLTGEADVQAALRLKTGETIPYYFTGKAVEFEGRLCLAGVGIDFSDRLKAQEKIRETTEKLRELAAHLQHIREEERIDIARDIHDDLGQQLTAVKIALFRLMRHTNGNAVVEKGLDAAMELLGNSIESIRRIATQLRPGVLDDLGLVEAMKWQIDEFSERYGIPVEAQLPESIDIPDPEVAINLFRIFQETLTNIARHAGAGRVAVRVEAGSRSIRLEVDDDGRGFNSEEINAKRTLGLLGMQERALVIGGHFAIEGRPGHGTTVRISVPVDNKTNAYAHPDC